MLHAAHCGQPSSCNHETSTHRITSITHPASGAYDAGGAFLGRSHRADAIEIDLTQQAALKGAAASGGAGMLNACLRIDLFPGQNAQSRLEYVSITNKSSAMLSPLTVQDVAQLLCPGGRSLEGLANGLVDLIGLHTGDGGIRGAAFGCDLLTQGRETFR